jgi:hypothetical protein
VALVLTFRVMASDFVRNVRVIWSGSPQSDAVVVWDGAAADEDTLLLYDTVSRTGQANDYTCKIRVSETGLYTEGIKNTSEESASEPVSPDLFYHHAVLTNLEPDTVYYLAVKTAEGPEREYHFRTAPKDGTTFKLIYAGDSRSRIDITRKMSMQIRELFEKDESIVALLHGGDYAETTQRDKWKAWLEAYALTTTKNGKLLPIIPIIGNHDTVGNSPMFRQAYGNPGGKNAYYALRLTPSVSILCLNTEISAEGEQKEFLRNALAGMEKDKVKWRIAAFHSPAYPAVKQPGAARTSWVPFFEEFNIDLVLESDGHCIKRTVPIRKDREADDGIVYLGEGGYGAPQRDPKPDLWYLQGKNAFASKGDHIMMLEIAPDAIHYSTVLVTGEVVDSAAFKPHR